MIINYITAAITSEYQALRPVREENQSYERADLLVMPRSTLVRLVLQHQEARWTELVGGYGARHMLAQVQVELFETERELETERRECARLRSEIANRS